MYRSLNHALLIRLAVWHPGQVGAWPDLTSPDAAAGWQPWLHQTMQLPGFAAALEHASPALAERIAAALAGGLSQPNTRRVVLAVMRYLLRASTRATPYGLFAGVAPAIADRTASVRLGTAHRPVARIGSAWLTEVLDHLETDPRLRPHLLLRANNLLRDRGGRLVLEHRASRTPRGAPLHLRIRSTGAIRAVLTLSTDRIRWSDLTDKISAERGAATDAVDRLVAQLISQRVLLTNLRPPSTETDPLGAVVDQLEALHRDGADTGEWLRRLGRVRDRKTQHDQVADWTAAAVPRRDLDTAVAAIADRVPPVAVDLRMDCDLILPTTVTAEASRAAAVLARLARPTTIGWRDWHARFLGRYGLYALVPVLDAVDDDAGLGYPAGFAGAPPSPPAVITDRDRGLLALAQRAALRREREITITDAMLDTICGPIPAEVQPSAELTVRVHASTIQAITDGAFELSVVRACTSAFMTAGRVLDLFDEPDRRRFVAAAGGQPARRGALAVQVSAVTRYVVSLDVARAPQILPHLVVVGEYHARGPEVIDLDDIAVTADAERLCLVSISRQCALQPVPFNAVEPVRHTLPIARFLTEAPAAFAAPCAPLEWGPAARDLPFIPALRYGRTLLGPTRWLLRTADLPGPRTAWEQWDHALTGWLRTSNCPAAVSLGVGDQIIGLDLDEPAHRALLRDHLTQQPAAALRAHPAGNDWIGGHSHEIVIPLAATTPPPPTPRLGGHLVDVRRHGIPPGGTHQYLKVYARAEQQTTILTSHLPALLDQLPADGGWWFQRYTDPEPHLRLRTFALPTEAINTWVQELMDADLTRRVQFDTDFPELGRFGGLAAYTATTTVFAADSAAVLAQLAVSGHPHGPDWRALTAASMLDLATAVVGDPDAAMRWFITYTRAHHPPPERRVYDQAIELANPSNRGALANLPGGGQVLTCWNQRLQVLATWRADILTTGTIAPIDLLPHLLHLHHVRIAGPDLDSERSCLHLARVAALSWTTRRSP